MKAQINLLPDIKLVYIRSRRIKYIVCTISLFIITVTAAIMLILWHHAFRNQPDIIRGYEQTINDYVTDFNGPQNENISKYLTIQNQLNALDFLGDDKYYPFIFEIFLDSFLPSEFRQGPTAIINSYEIDFEDLNDIDDKKYGSFKINAHVWLDEKEDEALVYHFANAYYEQQVLDAQAGKNVWRCPGPPGQSNDRENLAYCPIFPAIEWSSAEGTTSEPRWIPVSISGAINHKIFAKGQPPVRAKLRPGCVSSSCLGVPITEIHLPTAPIEPTGTDPANPNPAPNQ